MAKNESVNDQIDRLMKRTIEREKMAKDGGSRGYKPDLSGCAMLAPAFQPASVTIGQPAFGAAKSTRSAARGYGGLRPTTASGDRTLTLSSYLFENNHRRDVRWIVQDFLPQGGVSMIAGAPASGKSFLALDLAWHIATGQPWMGLATTKTSVLYVDEEMGSAILTPRLTQMGFGGRYKGAEVPLSISDRRGYKLDDPDLMGELMRVISYFGAGLVIFDSMVAVHNYPESGNSEMSRLRDDLRPILDNGGTVLFIHHTRKGAGGRNVGQPADVRGAGDIGAMVDMAFCVDKEEGGTSRVTPTKTRIIAESDAACFSFRIETDAQGILRVVRAKGPKDVRKKEAEFRSRILDVLREKGELKSTDLVGACGRRRDTVLKAADGLAADGLIVKEVRRERGAPAYYRLKAA